MKQQFIKDVADTLRLTIYSDNRALIPTSGNVTIYKPDGSTLQAQTAATVDGTTGEMTYSLTTTHTATLDLNYKVVWDYVVSSITYYETQLFDVVRSRLSIPIVDDDLYNELSSLRDTEYQQTGTATSASSSTLVDTARRAEVDNFWKGGVIEILSGTGKDQIRTITSSTQSSKTLNITPNWVTTPDTTSTYRVVKSFTEKIEAAFEELEQMLYNKGRRHELVLESSQIRMPLIYLTLEKICRDLSTEIDDKWDRHAITYEGKFEKHFNILKLDYDEDDSGFIDEDEEQLNANTFNVFRG